MTSGRCYWLNDEQTEYLTELIESDLWDPAAHDEDALKFRHQLRKKFESRNQRDGAVPSSTGENDRLPR